MDCVRFDDVAAFEHYAGSFLADNALENNVILGLIRGLKAQPKTNVLLLTVDRGNRPCLAAVMTPPFKLLLSAGDAAAIPSLIAGVLEAGAPVSGMLGLDDMADAFAEAWRAATGGTATPATAMTLYATREAIAPDGVPGTLRAATDTDADWVADAYVAFYDEIEAEEHERSAARGTAAGMLRRGLVYLWEDAGAPVSMVCFRYVTKEGARIAPVWTPPALRGRRYASAAVGRLTGELLHAGVDWCALFADVDNPTSNNIYRRLGYNEACGYRVYDLAPAAKSQAEA